ASHGWLGTTESWPPSYRCPGSTRSYTSSCSSAAGCRPCDRDASAETYGRTSRCSIHGLTCRAEGQEARPRHASSSQGPGSKTRSGRAETGLVEDREGRVGSSRRGSCDSRSGPGRPMAANAESGGAVYCDLRRYTDPPRRSGSWDPCLGVVAALL